MKPMLRQVGITVILAAGIYFLLQFTIQSSVVIGSSMEPNFQDGQWIIVSKVSYKLHDPERGDVVVLDPPTSNQMDYIKRIVGLPGDTVEIKDGQVLINGSPIDEPYIEYPPDYIYKEQKVPEGQYFVLGDYRPISVDSHLGWMLPRENIIGKAWLCIWPPSDLKVIPGYSLLEE